MFSYILRGTNRAESCIDLHQACHSPAEFLEFIHLLQMIHNHISSPYTWKSSGRAKVLREKDVEAALQQSQAHCTQSTSNDLQRGLSPNVTLRCGGWNDLYNFHVLINVHICTAEMVYN